MMAAASVYFMQVGIYLYNCLSAGHLDVASKRQSQYFIAEMILSSKLLQAQEEAGIFVDDAYLFDQSTVHTGRRLQQSMTADAVRISVSLCLMLPVCLRYFESKSCLSNEYIKVNYIYPSQSPDLLW